MKEVTVTLTLDEGQRRRLDEFAALRRKCEIVPRPGNCYTHEATLQYILSVVSFDAIVDEATEWEQGLLKTRKEASSEFWGYEPSEDDEEEGYLPACNPSPEESETVSNGEEEQEPVFSAEEELAIRSLASEMNNEQREKLDELLALYRRYDLCIYGCEPLFDEDFSEKSALSAVLSSMAEGYTLDRALEHLIWHWSIIVRREENRAQSVPDEEAGYLPVRNPSPEEATPEEPETVSNGEEEAPARADGEVGTLPQLIEDRTDEYFNYLEHGTMPKDSHETLIPVIDADGVHRMATLGEVEEMREAAQGIYNGASPEPKEPEDSFRDKGYLYDPARYEDDAYECGSTVVDNPETLAFADALLAALYRR